MAISAFLPFAYLQILDLLSTVAFLLHGIEEGNPLVRAVLQWGQSPLLGLVVTKIFALSLGLYCCWFGRQRLLVSMNVLFATVVAWNIVVLIVSAPALR